VKLGGNMYIYLIRHGDKYEEYGNRDLLELTEKGYSQAELLGKRLSRYNMFIPLMIMLT
jgi:broad specificity phosphatase PhoE